MTTTTDQTCSTGVRGVRERLCLTRKRLGDITKYRMGMENVHINSEHYLLRD